MPALSSFDPDEDQTFEEMFLEWCEVNDFAPDRELLEVFRSAIDFLSQY